MSHFTVMVTGEDVDGALAPYQENNEGTTDPEYLEFEVEVEAAEVAKRAQELRDEKKEDGTAKHPEYAEKSDEDVLQSYYGGERNENGDWGYWSNPNSKWDWYQVGGRWAGALKLKEGRTGEHGERSWANSKESTFWTSFTPEGYCDQARKGDIDIEGMRADAVEKAEKLWEKYEGIVKEHGPLPGDEWRKLDHTSEEFKAAKEAYWNHPATKAVQELMGGWGMPSDAFGMTKEEFIEKARLEAMPGYAMLHDGEWMEPGAMGWFGMSDETPKSRIEYLRKVNEIIDSLPDDTLITMVDCHI